MAYVLALVGLGLMIGLPGAGSAIGLASGGSAVLGMLKKKPEAFGTGLVLSGLPATQGLYGFVAFEEDYLGVLHQKYALKPAQAQLHG